MKHLHFISRKLFSGNLQGIKPRSLAGKKTFLPFIVFLILLQASVGAFGECTGSIFNATGRYDIKKGHTSGAPNATWTGGVSDDWDDTGNWFMGIFPDAATDAFIPAGLSLYPIITREVSVHDINIEAGASLTVTAGTLKISGAILNDGTFDVAAGTIEMNGVSPQTIPAFAFANNTIMDIIITNDVTFTGKDTVTGTIYFGGSNKTLTTGDSLTLKSTLSNTARVNDLTNNGNNSGNIVSGKINIERYIPLRKAWRLMATPISSTGAPTINETWQEGVTTASAYPNPNPGYGVKITGGTTGNGFDQSPNNAASIKVFHNASNLFSALEAYPGTNRPITDYPGYFLYVRGDRSIDLMQGLSAAITATTARIKGAINMGTQTVPVAATNLSILGNPYPSAINFETLTRTNVKNAFYLWDPELSGTFGLGAYVTVIWNEETNVYDATASVSPVSKYIPSGTAIIVQSEDGLNPGQIDVKETDKVSNNPGPSISRLNSEQQQLRVNLLMVNTDNTTSVLDGVLTTYSNNNNNGVDQNDANKMYGSNESINLKRGNAAIAIERRKTIAENDTSFLNIYQMKVQNYRFEIEATNMDHSGMTAVIRDRYLHANDSIPLSLSGTTYIDFSINADPASYNVNRFSIEFKQLSILPVIFRTVNAYQKGKDIMVEWKTENERNIDHYDIERSGTGNSLVKLTTVAPVTINGGSAGYQFLDTAPLEGNNYYRIHSVVLNGSGSYSNILKVNITKKNETATILASPNPVSGNTISLLVKRIPKGIYNLRLYNLAGQLVAEKNMNHDGTAQYINFAIGENIPAGKYELRLNGLTINIKTAVIKTM